MKPISKNLIFYTSLIFLVFLLGCECPSTNENQLPKCIITNLVDGDTLDLLGSYTFSIDAYDTDGYIESVIVFINEKGYQKGNKVPIQMNISYDEIGSDSCIIQALAMDNQDGIARDTVKIWFKEEDPFKGMAVRDISGAISRNTVFSKDTIWHIVGNCLIDEGVELIIEPGTIISFASNKSDPYSGYRIGIKGSLIAKGSSLQRIIFRSDNLSKGKWGGLHFKDESVDWDPANSSGSVLEFCEFYNGGFLDGISGTLLLEDARPLIKSNSFYNSITYDLVSNGNRERKKLLVFENHFTGYITIRNDLWFKENTIDDGGFLGLDTPIEAIIERNIFANLYESFGLGLDDDMSAVQIRNNDFKDSNIAIRTYHVDQAPIIKQNNFVNLKYAIYLVKTVVDFDATNNYWGTKDSLSISTLVYDFYDDFDLGKVDFSKFSTEKYEH